MPTPSTIVQVALHTPSHSGVGDLLSYASEHPLAPGTLVRVPLGTREVLGVVWDTDEATGELPDGATLRPIAGVLDGVAPLDLPWRRLVAFAARYYQRALGEVATAALPPQLRDLRPEQLARRLRRPAKAGGDTSNAIENIALTPEQESAKARISAEKGPFLLFGSTGSGKTEVYLRCVQEMLEADPTAQALVMVPEINLTPQLEERFVGRFAPRFGTGAVVSLHSGMTNPQRLKSWLAAHSGSAHIVLGTRMAVFASLPGLKLIVVDEEHDPSYKQQEGARYSARDLAIWRGREQGAKVILGSATPSLESWYASRPPTADDPEGGRYVRLHMPSRIGAGALARVRRVDMNQQPRRTVFSAPLLQAIAQDPVLRSLKLVAEPWDLGPGGHRLGAFPAGWGEWNDRYRDTVRRYWRGDGGQVGDLAYRLAGSSDLYQDAGRRPCASVNFVTCHDGFTLADLVSHDTRHNEANGEGNRDGNAENFSWNCGVEGPTDDPVILALREQQMRNFLATLFLSQGIPMLMAGDEIGRTQGGNNNAYCQDNETSWLDWELDDCGRRLLHFTRSLIRLRRRHPEFEHSRFFRGERVADVKDIMWLTPDGTEMTTGSWRDPEVRALGARLSGRDMEDVDEHGTRLTDDTFLILLNAGEDPVHFVLPDAHPGDGWQAVVDTAVAMESRPEVLDIRGTVAVVGRSLLLLRACSARE